MLAKANGVKMTERERKELIDKLTEKMEKAAKMLEYEIHSVEEHQLPECLEAIHAAFGESARIYGYTRETYPSSAAYLTLEELAAAKARGVHMYAAYVDGIKVKMPCFVTEVLHSAKPTNSTA